MLSKSSEARHKSYIWLLFDGFLHSRNKFGRRASTFKVYRLEAYLFIVVPIKAELFMVGAHSSSSSFPSPETPIKLIAFDGLLIESAGRRH